MFLFSSLFVQVVIGIRIQKLYLSKMSKNGKLVEYLDMKDQVEKGGNCFHIQDITNLNLFGYLRVNLEILTVNLETLND